MVKAIRIHAPGGPEAMILDEVELAAPGAGQALVRHTAIGINYIDVYHRTGAYPNPTPYGIGMEGAGVVEAVGPGVTDVKVGDRVGYTGGAPGSYAERRLYDAARLVVLPAGIPDKIAATLMLKGMTVRYLLRQTHVVNAGDTILVHAIAGGIGLFLCDWAKHLGVTVIGTTSSPDKAALAKAHGCDHVILYNKENFVERSKELTGGKGVAVAYDGVGKDTFLGSLETLAVRGHLVNFGSSSGPPAPIAPAEFAKKSNSLTRPSLFHYIQTRAELVENSSEVFDLVLKGVLKVETPREYALKDAVQSHKDLEGRKTTGPSILIP